MNYQNYVRKVLFEHLLIPSYLHLPNTESKNRIETTKQWLQDLLNKHKNELSQIEFTHLKK